MKSHLGREAIEFYTQRRKQYTEDFKKMTNQFKPKLNELTKKLIARKHGIDNVGNTYMHHQPKKVKQVLASLSKSDEVQKKIDTEMIRRACKYSLAQVPILSFDYTETCHKIQNAMVPLIKNLDNQLLLKRDEILQIEENDVDIHPKDLQDKKDVLYRMKHKAKRLRQIVTKLIHMQNQTEERIYHETIRRLEQFDEDSEKDDEQLPFSSRKLISKRKIDENTEHQKRFQNFELMRIEENQKEQKQYQNQLDQKIKTHYQKLGLTTHRKILSIPELKEFLLKCKTESQIPLITPSQSVKHMELKQLLSNNTNNNETIKMKPFQSTLQLTTNVPSNTFSRCRSIVSNEMTTTISKQCKSEHQKLKQINKNAVFGFNKIQTRLNKMHKTLDSGTNFNFQDNKLILL